MRKRTLTKLENFSGNDRDGRVSGADVLNYLRFVAMSCRAKPQSNLFEACALLHVDRTKTIEAHAEALVRGLDEALGQKARLHAPGVAEMSFDEAWLQQFAEALRRGDSASVQFLLGSRVGPSHRRLMKFLMGRVVSLACE